MAYQYPGQAFYHTLTALKGWYEESSLDAEVQLDSNVNLAGTNQPVYPGSVIHSTSIAAAIAPYTGPINGPGTFLCEMGCAGVPGGGSAQYPMYLWSASYNPDISNTGVPAGVPASGTQANPADFISVLPAQQNQNMVALVWSGGYEFETTEYDPVQTYVTGQPLRCVSSNTDPNGGKLTNQRATSIPFNSAGLLQIGDPTLSAWDTVVGWVSRGTYTNAATRPVLGFIAAFVPGTR